MRLLSPVVHHGDSRPPTNTDSWFNSGLGKCNVCSAHFCHLNHFCHSSPVLSIHINRFCQPHHFCQLMSTQSSPVLSTISTTYVATDEVTTSVNKARPLLSTVMLFPIYKYYAQSTDMAQSQFEVGLIS